MRQPPRASYSFLILQVPLLSCHVTCQQKKLSLVLFLRKAPWSLNFRCERRQVQQSITVDWGPKLFSKSCWEFTSCKLWAQRRAKISRVPFTVIAYDAFECCMVCVCAPEDMCAGDPHWWCAFVYLLWLLNLRWRIKQLLEWALKAHLFTSILKSRTGPQGRRMQDKDSHFI